MKIPQNKLFINFTTQILCSSSLISTHDCNLSVHRIFLSSLMLHKLLLLHLFFGMCRHPLDSWSDASQPVLYHNHGRSFFPWFSPCILWCGSPHLPYRSFRLSAITVFYADSTFISLWRDTVGTVLELSFWNFCLSNSLLCSLKVCICSCSSRIPTFSCE